MPNSATKERTGEFWGKVTRTDSLDGIEWDVREDDVVVQEASTHRCGTIGVVSRSKIETWTDCTRRGKKGRRRPRWSEVS